MDLSTTYLGLELAHPLMPGASPMVDDLDRVRQLEDAGASAIVMHSLFEEQIVLEQLAAHRYMDQTAHAYAESQSYFPTTDAFALGPDAYLEQLRRIRETVSVPVIASLNGASPGGWLEYARLMEQAGAHALELNLFLLATDLERSGAAIEGRVLEIVRAVKASVRIPVAVKLSPFFSSLPHLVKQLEAAGADGVVLFNRFYQPDIDVEALAVVPELHLSEPEELLLRLRWIAILSGRVRTSLAVTGGVHTTLDAVKSVMAGAHAVQMVSALLRRGPEYLAEMLAGLSTWLELHEYASLRQMQGSMSLERCPEPGAWSRGNYVKILQRWHGIIGADNSF